MERVLVHVLQLVGGPAAKVELAEEEAEGVENVGRHFDGADFPVSLVQLFWSKHDVVRDEFLRRTRRGGAW